MARSLFPTNCLLFTWPGRAAMCVAQDTLAAHGVPAYVCNHGPTKLAVGESWEDAITEALHKCAAPGRRHAPRRTLVPCFSPCRFSPRAWWTKSVPRLLCCL